MKLSNESPVGKAIMGHKKGETVEVSAPRGSLKFKILEIKAAWPDAEVLASVPVEIPAQPASPVGQFVLQGCAIHRL